MANLLLPDIAGTAMQGFQQGRNMAANKLIGLAMQNPDQSSQYFGQAAQINPGAVLDVQNAQARQQYMQGLGQVAQEKAAQAQQSASLQKIGAAARYMAGALQTNDPNKIEGAYQAVRPYLAELGQAQGKQPPPQWDPSMTSAIYHVIAQTASAFPDDMKLQTVTPGSVVTRGGEPVYSNPAAPKIIAGGDGRQYAVSPGQNGNLVAAPIAVRGAGIAPQAAPQAQAAPQIGQPAPASTVAGAPAGTQVTQATGADGARVQFAFAPGTPDAVKAQAASMAGISQAQPEPMPQTLTAPAKGAQAPPTGYQWDATHTALQPIPGGPADKSQSIAALGDPNATGESYLQSIQDAGMRQLVKAIAEGREQVPRIYRSGKAGELGPTQIAAAVSQYDPTFNAQDYNSRNRTRIAFTSGKPYQDMMALSQASKHVGQLVPLITELAGHAIPFIGSSINAAENKASDVYSGKVTSWNTVADAVAHETRKVFAGSSGGTLAELDGYLKNLSPNSSTAQKQAAVQGIAELLESRIGLLRDAYAQGMGKAGDPFYTTFPESAQTLQYLTSLPQSQIGVMAMPQMPKSGFVVNPPSQQPASSGWSIEEVQQ